MFRQNRRTALLLLLMFPCLAAATPFSQHQNDPFLVAAGESVLVDPALLYAIALVESGTQWSDGTRRPSPYVIRLNGRGIHASSLDEIQAVWTAAQERGDRIEDVGPMQINVRYHQHRVDDPMQLLDPETNMRVAAQILREEIDRTDDLVTAIGRYHHSRHTARTRWYAGKVLRTYRQLTQGL